jgi:hypothetical protein
MENPSALNTVKAISARSEKASACFDGCDKCGFRNGAGYTDYFDFYFDLPDKQQRYTYVTRAATTV